MPIWKPIVVLLHTETYWHRNYRSKQTPADGEIIIETNDDDGRFTFLSGLQSGYNLSSGIIFCKIIIGFHGQILLKWSFQGRKIEFLSTIFSQLRLLMILNTSVRDQQLYYSRKKSKKWSQLKCPTSE